MAGESGFQTLMVSTIVIALVFLFILILGHEFGHLVAAKLCGLRVDEFGFGFPPKLFSRKRGETEYSLNLLPFGGFVRIYGETPPTEEKEELPDERSFLNQPFFKKAIVLPAGVLMNLVIAWLALVPVFLVGLPNHVLVAGILPQSPAASAGFKTGDEIIGFNKANDLIDFIKANTGKKISLKVMETGGQSQTISVVPKNGEIGVEISESGLPKENIFDAVIKSAGELWALVSLTVLSLFYFFESLFVGHYAVLSAVSGPVGIYHLLSFSKSLGVAYLLEFLALISVNLAVINIIPFPALDGGQLLFASIERIIKKPLNYRFQALANKIGFTLLLLLMIAVTIKDILS